MEGEGKRVWVGLAGVVLCLGLFGLMEYVRWRNERPPRVPARAVGVAKPAAQTPHVARRARLGGVDAQAVGRRVWKGRKATVAIALAGGWVDTGARKSISVSGKVQMRLYALYPGPKPYFADWRFGTLIIGDQEILCVQNPGGGWHQLEVYPPKEQQPAWSQHYAYADSQGPYRLGARYTNPGGYPVYSAESTLEFAWFADRETYRDESCAGITRPRRYYDPQSEDGWNEEQQEEFEPANMGRWIGGLYFGGEPGDEPEVLHTKFTELSCDGVLLDTTGLNIEGDFVGQGNGVVHQYGQPGGPQHQTRNGFAYPPMLPVYDCKISKAGTDAPDWARAVDSLVCDPTQGYRTDRTYLTFPTDNGLKVAWRRSWGDWWSRAGSLGLQGEWLTAEAQAPDPELPTTDAKVPLRGVVPIGLGASWEAGKLSVGQVLGVNYHEHGQPSRWRGGAGVVVEDDDAKQITRLVVSQDGGEATRELATLWRHRINKPRPETPPEEVDPLWSVDGYTWSKHLEPGEVPEGLLGEAPDGEDRWWWNTYGWARVVVKAPGAGVVTLRTDWTRLDVSDPHVTGWERVEEMEFEQAAGSATYRVELREDQKDEQGRYVAWVDLLFPQESEGLPRYPGRVDRLRLSGLAKGTYELHGLDLVHRESGVLKAGHGVPVRRRTAGDLEALQESMTPEEWARWVAWNLPKWPVLTLAVDGSHGFGEVPDQAEKQDEVGQTGGSIRQVEPITGAVSGLIMDQQLTLQAWCGMLDRVEGVTCTYSQEAEDAALKDEFGNRLATPLADWLWPMWEQGLAPAQDVMLRASPVCGQIWTANGQQIPLRAEQALWGQIEGFVTRGARPMAEEERPTLYAAYCPDPEEDPEVLQVVASATADAMGQCVLAPVPANGLREYEVMTREGLEEYEGEHPGKVVWG